MSATFQDIDGKTLEYDQWYPMDPYPYLDRGDTLLPVSLYIAHHLQRLHKDGTVHWWTPWGVTPWLEFTHWRMKLWDWYEI